MTKLNSRLPKGDANGLDSLARNMLEEPHQVHVVIALVDCLRFTTDVDEGTSEPTARIRRVEVITEADKGQAQVMLRRALEKRTGKTVLPFDLEEDMRAAFVDFETGEIHDEGTDD
jgi:hypothetical protein